jgi:hypothetical protein
MAIILHLAHNMDEDDAPDATAPHISPPPISAFVGADRGSHSGRGHPPRGPRGGRGLPTKCSACGSPDHILSSCTAPDDAVMRWTLAKRKMIIKKYGAPSGSHPAHAALLSDVPADNSDSLPTLEECTDEYDETEASVPFSSVAFSSSLTPGRNLSEFGVVDSACSINLTAFKSDFARFTPPPLPRALEGLVLTSRAVAPSGFQSGLPLGGLFTAPAGGAAAAAPEGGTLACPSALTSTSTRWALVTP